MPTVPNHPIRVNGTPMIAIIGATIGGLYAHSIASGSPAAIALVWAVTGPLAYTITDELLAARRSPHVVYMLHNDQHEVIYVGETEDIDRRIAEHVNGEHDWSNDIYGYTIARHCHSDRQAKRIERRMITVINSCADPGVLGSFCHPLRNEIYDDRHRQAHVRVAVALWKLPYLAASIILNNRCFHTPATLTRPVPSPADSDLDDELDEPTGPTDQPDPGPEDTPIRPEPGDPFDEIVNQLRAEGFDAGPDVPTDVPTSQRPNPPVGPVGAIPPDRDNRDIGTPDRDTNQAPDPSTPTELPPISAGSADSGAQERPAAAGTAAHPSGGPVDAHGRSQPADPGPGRTKRCRDCGEAATKIGPRCDTCHRDNERTRKRRLRRKVDGLIEGEGSGEGTGTDVG